MSTLAQQYKTQTKTRAAERHEWKQLLHRIESRVQTAVASFGDTVEQSGVYVCVPCGHRQWYNKGDMFSSCLICSVQPFEAHTEEYVEGLELWERVNS